MKTLFMCKFRREEKMEIEHITAKEAYIARMKMRSLSSKVSTISRS